MKAITLLSFLLLTIVPHRLTACLCDTPPVGSAYAQARAVVLGAVVDDEEIMRIGPHGHNYSFHLYTLEIEHRWKGAESRTMSVIAGGPSSCDIRLRVGERLLIYGRAMGSGDTTFVGMCNRVIDALKAGNDIRQINYLTGNQSAAALDLGGGAIDNDDWKIGFIAGASFRYLFTPHLSLRARLGYSYLPFDFALKTAGAASESSSGREMQIISASVEAMLWWPADRGVVAFYLFAGPDFAWYEIGDGRVEVSGMSLPIEGASDRAFGIAGGIGLDIPLGGRTSLFIEARSLFNVEDVGANRVVISATSGVQVLL